MQRQASKVRIVLVSTLCAMAMPAQAWGRPPAPLEAPRPDRPQLPRCTVTDDNAHNLGSFDSDAEAIAAAKSKLPSGHYGVATIGDEAVTLTHDGRIYDADVCVGSGLPPRDSKDDDK